MKRMCCNGLLKRSELLANLEGLIFEMQIAIVGRDIRPPWNEAVKNMAYELARELCVVGHNVHLISNGIENIETVPNLQLHSVDRSSFNRDVVDIVRRLESSRQIDILHVQNLIVHRSLAGLVKSLKIETKAPVVAYCCQLPTLSVSNWLRVLKKDPREAFSSKLGMLAPQFLTRSAMESIDMVISSSKYIQKHLDKAQDQKRVVHPFVNALSLRPHMLQRTSTSAPKRLLYLGNHRVLRGEDDFLRMFAHLKKEIPDVRATLVTTIPIPKRIRRLVGRLGIAGAIEFLPRNVQLDVLGLIEASDLFVFTGLPPVGSIDPPLTLIESIIIGTPVASYDAAGINEVVDSNNLVKYGDIRSLAEVALKQLQSDLTRRPRPDLLEKFSSQNATSRFVGLYQSLTNN
jgi:glycosyltransferase involved in cell wall biosynthesis